MTGGLPRVAELCEARSPKDAGMLAEVTGTVSFGKDTKGRTKKKIKKEQRLNAPVESKDCVVLATFWYCLQKQESIAYISV